MEGATLWRLSLVGEEMTEYLKEISYMVWQGKEIDIGDLSTQISEFVDEMFENIDKMRLGGIEFPIQYVKQAIANYTNAMNSGDEYLLAQSLYFEWREIAIVYEELLDEINTI